MLRRASQLADSATGESISKIGRSVLKKQLRTVLKLLKLAAEESDRDVEFVHQLRIMTRKTEAALALFADATRRIAVKELKAELRRIRRAAGEARDVDVNNQRLFASILGEDFGIRSEAIAFARRQRKELQQPIEAAYRRVKRKRIKANLLDMVRTDLWKKSLRKRNAKLILAHGYHDMVQDFLTSTELELTDIDSFHQARKAAKRLRYATDFLGEDFHPQLRELAPAFLELQQRMGSVMDYFQSARLLAEWSKLAKNADLAWTLDEMSRIERQRTEMNHNLFLQWFTEDLRNDLRMRFTRVLNDTI
ncbi:MAG: CHAD domain-containing protein [Pirellulaceae bacterium]